MVVPLKMARSSDRLRHDRDEEGAAPGGGVRRSGVRLRARTLAERLDALELTDPCRDIAAIWKRYQPVVWARLQRPTIPEDVRSDLLIEVYWNMHADILQKERVPALPGRTLSAITTHVICNYVRVRKRQPAFVPLEDLETEPAPSSRSSPERAVNQAQRDRFVWMILSLMDDGQRKLLEMVHFFDLTAEEIAGDLGVPAGTVRFRIFEARKRFRTLAERHRAKLGGAL
jgi:RNA polymerase sigma factor (sigma-70 family)